MRFCQTKTGMAAIRWQLFLGMKPTKTVTDWIAPAPSFCRLGFFQEMRQKGAPEFVIRKVMEKASTDGKVRGKNSNVCQKSINNKCIILRYFAMIHTYIYIYIYVFFFFFFFFLNVFMRNIMHDINNP